MKFSIRHLVIGSSVLVSASLLGSAFMITNAIKNPKREVEKQYQSQIVWQYAYGLQAQSQFGLGRVSEECSQISADLESLQELGWKIVSTMPAQSMVGGGTCYGREILLTKVMPAGSTLPSAAELVAMPDL